jgi:hypothetical protein
MLLNNALMSRSKSLALYFILLTIALMQQSSLQLESEQEDGGKSSSLIEGMNELKSDNINNNNNQQLVPKSRLNLAYLQREDTLRKLPTSLLLSLYLQELRNSGHVPYWHDEENDRGAENDGEEENAIENNEEELDSESDSEIADSLNNYIQKRSKSYLAKKESPFDQRSRDLRRQQAARWDIGFGKRAQGFKPKAFMDAYYGKRSGIKQAHPKISFGRKQQWDIQYGK